MNLVDGFILHTLAEGGKVSKHSQLKRFFELDKLIGEAYDKDYKKAFHSLEIYFMQIEARTLLHTLGIL